MTPGADTEEHDGVVVASTKKSNTNNNTQNSHNARAQASYNSNNINHAEEEELTVDPMKQDFHFYAMDHRDEVTQQCKQQLLQSSLSSNNNNNQLYLLTTLVNARLIQNWTHASPQIRAQYAAMEETDRKRFMGEEEVASRHCATLTARRRVPKVVSGEGGEGVVGSGGGGGNAAGKK